MIGDRSREMPSVRGTYSYRAETVGSGAGQPPAAVGGRQEGRQPRLLPSAEGGVGQAKKAGCLQSSGPCFLLHLVDMLEIKANLYRVLTSYAITSFNPPDHPMRCALLECLFYR